MTALLGMLWFSIFTMFIGFLFGYRQAIFHDWWGNGWIFLVILLAVACCGFTLAAVIDEVD